jgi:glutamine synthetase
LSPLALHYVAGLLTHVDALLGLTSPTTNSYKRLVPHYEAPVNVAFSKRNRSACVRIPMYYSGPESAASKRIEFRPPDPSCNPYLAFAAMLMAGLDGIRRRMDASRFGPLDVNTYELPPEEAAKVKSVPGSLAAVLDALEADHEFLLEGDVFTRDLLETWIAYKRERELHEVNIRPHPYEFYLYYDV